VAAGKNNFHMSFGEMTITLDDVPILVSISIMSRSVNTPRGLSMQMRCLLGYCVSPHDAHDKLGMIRGHSVRLE